MRIQQPIDTSDLLDVGDMLVNKNSSLQQNSVENVIPFLYKMGKKKRCFYTAVGVIAFLDPWKKARGQHPGVHLGTSPC